MKTPSLHAAALWALSVSSIAAWGLLLAPSLVPQASATAGSSTVRELTVERINIVDRSGKTRLVIANQERFPDPVARGKTIERSIRNTAGMVLYDSEGNEAGGLVTSRAGNGNAMGALILDYGHQPTDGIGIVKSETADGKNYWAGLTVADRRPYVPGDIASSEGVSRIWVGNKSQEAGIELSDTQGNTRIRIAVDSNNVPAFDVLDASGNVVKRLIVQ